MEGVFTQMSPCSGTEMNNLNVGGQRSDGLQACEMVNKQNIPFSLTSSLRCFVLQEYLD